MLAKDAIPAARINPPFVEISTEVMGHLGTFVLEMTQDEFVSAMKSDGPFIVLDIVKVDDSVQKDTQGVEFAAIFAHIVSTT